MPRVRTRAVAARRRPPAALRVPEQWALPDTLSSSGGFETMRAYQGRIFRLDQHLDRLAGTAQYLGLRLSLEREQLRDRLVQVLRGSGVPEAVVRVALIPVSADASSGWRTAQPSIVVQPAQWPPAAWYRRGIRVAVVPTRKFPSAQISPQAKYSARLGSVMAVMDAQLRQVEEALFMDALGYVTESTASNFGIVARGEFAAPPCWLGLLAGVTWGALTEAASAVGLRYRETPLTRHDLYNAEEAFVCSTLKELLPVTVIDGRRIGGGRPGPWAGKLHRAFRTIVRRELDLPARYVFGPVAEEGA